MLMQDHEKSRSQLLQELEALRQELQIVNDKYDSLFEGAGDSILIIDAETLRILAANTNAMRRLGYTGAELLALTLDDIEVIDDADSANDLEWTSSFSGTQVYACQYRRKDGSLMPVEVSSRLVQHNHRDVIQNFVRDITERKRAQSHREHIERDLKDSEKRFREMTDLLPGAVIEMDTDFTITYINQFGLELVGYSEADIAAGLNAIEILHPEDREQAAQRIAQHFEGKYVPPIEYRILTKPGDEVPILLKAAPIRRDGEIAGFRASITDIRRLKETEKALKTSEQQLRFVTDSLPAYVAYVGVDDLRYRFVNRRFEEGYARSRDSIVGQHIKDIIGESNYQFARKYIDMVRSGQATSYINIFPTVQGKRWIEVNYVPTFDEHGAVEGIAVLSFDITEQKQAEEALRESQELFASFMDILPHGIFIKEEDCTVIYVNQYVKDLFNAQTWLGKDAHGAFPDFPDLAEAMMADDRDALARGQTRVEESMPDKDGNEHVFVTTKFRIERANKPPLLGGIGLDITERVKTERELAAALETARQLQDKAEAANRAKSAFLANISHALRTPLNAILGFARIASRNPALPPSVDDNLEVIIRSGEQLLVLINQLLDLTRIESGHIAFDETDDDLHHLISSTQQQHPDHEALSPDEAKTALNAVPLDLLMRLKDGLELGDMTVIDQTIAEIRTHHVALADTLYQSAQRFQFNELLSLLEGKEDS